MACLASRFERFRDSNLQIGFSLAKDMCYITSSEVGTSVLTSVVGTDTNISLS